MGGRCFSWGIFLTLGLKLIFGVPSGFLAARHGGHPFLLALLTAFMCLVFSCIMYLAPQSLQTLTVANVLLVIIEAIAVGVGAWLGVWQVQRHRRSGH